MQILTQLLAEDGASPLGWALIAAALALAADALAGCRTSRAAAWLLSYRPAQHLSPAPAPIMEDPLARWQRVTAITDHALSQYERAAELDDRAAWELDAADAALHQLRAELAAGAMQSGGSRTEPSDERAHRPPLAA
jgi:hypothetical protein